MKTEGERREKYARIRSLYSLYMLNLSSNCTNVCMSTRHWWWEREKKKSRTECSNTKQKKRRKRNESWIFLFWSLLITWLRFTFILIIIFNDVKNWQYEQVSICIYLLYK